MQTYPKWGFYWLIQGIKPGVIYYLSRGFLAWITNLTSRSPLTRIPRSTKLLVAGVKTLHGAIPKVSNCQSFDDLIHADSLVYFNSSLGHLLVLWIKCKSCICILLWIFVITVNICLSFVALISFSLLRKGRAVDTGRNWRAIDEISWDCRGIVSNDICFYLVCLSLQY